METINVILSMVAFVAIVVVIFAVCVNVGVLYFTVRHKKLRDLPVKFNLFPFEIFQIQVGGLIMLSSSNDVIMNLYIISLTPKMWYALTDTFSTYKQCTFMEAGKNIVPNFENNTI